MDTTTGTSTHLARRAEHGKGAGLDMPCREEFRLEGQPDAALWQAVPPTREPCVPKPA